MTTFLPGPRRKGTPSTVSNVLWNWGVFAFTVAVTFVLSPYIVHRLGDTTYGIWVLLGSLVGYLGFLDFGVRGAVTRYVAKLQAAGDHDDASRIASTAITIFAVMGLVAMAVSAVLATEIVHRFHITPSQAATARLVILMGGATVALSLVGGVFGGIVIGLQRFDLNGKLEVGVGLVRAAGVYLALDAQFGLVALALIQLAVSAARTTVTVWLAWFLYPQLQIRVGRWDRVAFRQIFSFSVYSTLLMFSSQLILYSDSVVIGAFLPIGAITFFSIPGSLTDYARSLVRGITTTLTPRTSALQVEKPHDIADLTLRGGRLATLVILPIAITFLLRGERFIDLWMGPSYGGLSGLILRILTISFALSVARQVAGAALMGLNEHRRLVPFYVTEALLNLGISLYWVQSMGLPGVAWGTTVPSLVTSLIVVPWYVRRVMDISIPRYWLESWGRPLAAMLPFAAATWTIERFWPGHGLLTYFAGVAAALPFAALGTWFLALDPPDRERVLKRWPGYEPSAAAPREGTPEIGIVAMVPDIWGGPWMPRHHILTRLAREYPVVWVQPPGAWKARWRSSDAWSEDSKSRRGQGLRILPWPPSWMHRERPRLLREAVERVHLYRAVRWLRRRRVQDVILYLWRPDFARAIDQVPHTLSCYHVDDEYTFTREEQPIPEQEAQVLRRVDQVIVHSPALLEKKGRVNSRTALIPNGVDYAAYATPVPAPHDLSRIRRPRIGYVGVIKSELDLALLAELARRRPGWQIVLVGPVRVGPETEEQVATLERLRNVHFLGAKHVSELPTYMQHMDVSLLCYRDTGYTKFIYPMKLHEYLATGRPVVGTPIRTLRDFDDVVRLATTPDEWEAAIEAALGAESNSAEQVARRQSVALAHDWNELATQVSTVLRERIAEKRALPSQLKKEEPLLRQAAEVETASAPRGAPRHPEVGIVALVPDVWGGPWMSRHQLLTRLGDHFQVAWVDWVPVDRSLWPGQQAWIHEVPRDLPGFSVHRPSWLRRHAVWSHTLSKWLESPRLHGVVQELRRRGAQRIVAYIWHPGFAPALDVIRPDFSCYHMVDEYSFSEVDLPVSDEEAGLIRRVDQVFVHSLTLYQKKGELNPNTAVVPNGVDFTRFAAAAPEPADLSPIPHPRIGYTGIVKRKLDLSLLLSLARRHPEWSFVFVGPMRAPAAASEAIAHLRQLANVYFLGPKSVDQLPGYIQHFDVATLCYVQDGYTKYIYPLKLHEYLAAGRPVVATPLPALEEFAHVIRFATTVPEWEAAISQTLSPGTNSPDGIENRRAVARMYDWGLLADRIAAVLLERLAEQREPVQAPGLDPALDSR